MRILAYRGPYIDEGDDHPSLDLDVEVPDRCEGVVDHGAAVKIFGAELIRSILPMLKAWGVSERPHCGKSFEL